MKDCSIAVSGALFLQESCSTRELCFFLIAMERPLCFNGFCVNSEFYLQLIAWLISKITSGECNWSSFCWSIWLSSIFSSIQLSDVTSLWKSCSHLFPSQVTILNEKATCTAHRNTQNWFEAFIGDCTHQANIERTYIFYETGFCISRMNEIFQKQWTSGARWKCCGFKFY